MRLKERPPGPRLWCFLKGGALQRSALLQSDSVASALCRGVALNAGIGIANRPRERREGRQMRGRACAPVGASRPGDAYPSARGERKAARACVSLAELDHAIWEGVSHPLMPIRICCTDVFDPETLWLQIVRQICRSKVVV